MDYSKKVLLSKKEIYDNLSTEVAEIEYLIDLEQIILKNEKRQLKKTLTLKQQHLLTSLIAAGCVVRLVVPVFNMATPFRFLYEIFLAYSSCGLFANFVFKGINKNVEKQMEITERNLNVSKERFLIKNKEKEIAYNNYVSYSNSFGTEVSDKVNTEEINLEKPKSKTKKIVHPIDKNRY